jgi:hypothetical protein
VRGELNWNRIDQRLCCLPCMAEQPTLWNFCSFFPSFSFILFYFYFFPICLLVAFHCINVTSFYSSSDFSFTLRRDYILTVQHNTKQLRIPFHRLTPRLSHLTSLHASRSRSRISRHAFTAYISTTHHQQPYDTKPGTDPIRSNNNSLHTWAHQ